jgi:pimeloyl-ACP methyl ester carboxylesterase
MVCLGAAATWIMASNAAPTGVSPIGHWEGELVQHGRSMPIGFDFNKAGAAWQGRFSAASWRVMDYPLEDVTVTADRIVFHMGDSELDGRLVGDEIAGQFQGEDGAGDFHLRRQVAAQLPYRELAVEFRNGPVRLAGTLAMPVTPGRHPAVVFAHGSGPEVRWGTNRFLADRFARAGIAALVFDKRGTGASGGDWRSATLEDLARDLLAGVDLLAARDDVDAARIGLHGHSEGGIVAPLAETLADGRVAFVIAEDTVVGRIRDQDLYRVTGDIQSQSWSPADKTKALELYGIFLDVASGDRPYAEFERARAGAQGQAWFEYLGLPPKEHWLWAFYRGRGNLDTRGIWRQVTHPVLIVYGERDRLVPVDLSVRRLEDILDTRPVSYAALVIPRAEHNLTIHPQADEPFFWWHVAPGLFDTEIAWTSRCTAVDGDCNAR